MLVDLTPADLAKLLDSLAYGKRYVSEARDTPSSVKQENLRVIEELEIKLRAARDGGATS